MTTNIAGLDENSRNVMKALSSVDGTSIVNLYADPVTHDCVSNCFDNQSDPTQNYFRNLNTGFCVFNCSPQFKDFVTGNCVDNCSAGYWGNRANNTCI